MSKCGPNDFSGTVAELLKGACDCLACCEFRMARDEDLACAQMFDYAIELRDRARKDWEHSASRLKAAIVARNVAHPAA